MLYFLYVNILNFIFLVNCIHLQILITILCYLLPYYFKFKLINIYINTSKKKSIYISSFLEFCFQSRISQSTIRLLIFKFPNLFTCKFK